MKDNFENHRLRTCLWIVDRLKKHPMSLRELNELWLKDDDLSAGKSLERRTFLNYIHAIYDLLHVDIQCNRKNEFRYYIASEERSQVKNWLLDDFRLQQTLGKATDLESRISLEFIPSSYDYLSLILNAMEHGQMVEFQYQAFNEQTISTHVAAPYGLKLYQQRWYTVMAEGDEPLHVFGLDRMTEVGISDQSFQAPADFNVDQFFRYSFGVRVEPDLEPSRILLKVKDVQVPYLRSLPLHPSQREVERHPGYSIFSLYLTPTVELTMKILSMGFLIEVLEPLYLRQTLMTEAASLYHIYFENQEKAKDK